MRFVERRFNDRTPQYKLDDNTANVVGKTSYEPFDPMLRYVPSRFNLDTASILNID